MFCIQELLHKTFQFDFAWFKHHVSFVTVQRVVTTTVAVVVVVVVVVGTVLLDSLLITLMSLCGAFPLLNY